MKSVGLYKYLPIEDPQSLVDLDIPQPNHPDRAHDLLVAIKASVNPVDTTVRRGLIPPPPSTASSSSLTGVNVIATASRAESLEWCKRMGADYVVNHHKSSQRGV